MPCRLNRAPHGNPRYGFQPVFIRFTQSRYANPGMAGQGDAPAEPERPKLSRSLALPLHSMRFGALNDVESGPLRPDAPTIHHPHIAMT